MRRLRTLWLTAPLALLPIAGEVVAQSPVSVTGELGYTSHYRFAGVPFAADDIGRAQVTVGTGSVTLYGATVLDLELDEITEFDLYGDYYMQLAPTVGAFVGAALYAFKFADPLGWETTPELYGGIVFTAPLNPTLYVAKDFDLSEGQHVTLMLSQDVALGTDGVTLGLAGNLDYNDEYWAGASGFSYFDVSAALSIPAGPVTLTPLVRVQRVLDDAFEDVLVAGVDNVEMFGVTASFALGG